MESLVNNFVVFIARMHAYILTLNDSDQKNLTDKQLHFLVIGILGMALILIIYPLFKMLSKNHVLVIAFLYVFTLILGMTFAIGIGQMISGEGTMKLGDVVFGITGFLLMFAIFAVVREVVLAIYNIVIAGRKKRKRK